MTWRVRLIDHSPVAGSRAGRPICRPSSVPACRAAGSTGGSATGPAAPPMVLLRTTLAASSTEMRTEGRPITGPVLVQCRRSKCAGSAA